MEPQSVRSPQSGNSKVLVPLLVEEPTQTAAPGHDGMFGVSTLLIKVGNPTDPLVPEGWLGPGHSRLPSIRPARHFPRRKQSTGTLLM